MKITPFYFLLILLSVVIISNIGCNKSTTVGSGLLENEDLALGFTDELIVKAKTIEEERIPTYFTGSFSNDVYMLGELDDPIFGKSSSFIHFEMELSNNGAASGLRGGTVDSMVFIFDYNSDGYYGDTLDAHDITIFRLNERIDQVDTLYSDQEFEIFPNLQMTPIASLEGFVPRQNDSITVGSYITEEDVRLQAQIRLRMDQLLAAEIIADSTANETNESLKDLINGFVMKSEPRNGNSMFSIDLNRNSGVSSVEVYFRGTDDVKRLFRYFVDGVRHQRFTADHSGSAIEPFLGQDITDGGPLFVQGMRGAITELDISSLLDLEDKLLNQVELRLFLDEAYPGDISRLFPEAQGLALTKASSGEPVEDLQIALASFQGTSGVDILFGGNLQDSIGGNQLGYSMNITAYAKEVQKGREDGKLHLELLNRIGSPRRAILFGPGHPTKSPELRVTYTLE